MTTPWMNIYELGIPEIDADHRRLLETLNSFLVDARVGASRQDLSTGLAQLVDLLALHFELEEALFDQYELPDASSHAAQHRRELATIRQISSLHESEPNPGEAAVRTAELLRNCILEHILAGDIPAGRACLRTPPSD